jgi:hypothetical protein
MFTQQGGKYPGGNVVWMYGDYHEPCSTEGTSRPGHRRPTSVSRLTRHNRSYDGGRGDPNFIPYKLAYKPPLCGPCETNDTSRAPVPWSTGTFCRARFVIIAIHPYHCRKVILDLKYLAHSTYQVSIKVEGHQRRVGLYLLPVTSACVRIVRAEISTSAFKGVSVFPIPGSSASIECAIFRSFTPPPSPLHHGQLAPQTLTFDFSKLVRLSSRSFGQHSRLAIELSVRCRRTTSYTLVLEREPR